MSAQSSTFRQLSKPEQKASAAFRQRETGETLNTESPCNTLEASVCWVALCTDPHWHSPSLLLWRHKKTLHSWAEERAFNSCDSSDSRESGAEEHRSETALKRKQLKMSAKELCINSIFVQKYSLEDLVIKKKKTLYKIFAKLSKLFQFFFPLVSPLFSCLSDTAGLLRSSLESKIKY